MRPSSTLCTARASHHRVLADAAGLDNVRRIELAAAAAWDKEGLLATRRESRVEAGQLAQLPDGPDDDHGDAPATPTGPECD